MRTALITLFYGLSLALSFCAGRGIGSSRRMSEFNDVLNKTASAADISARANMLREAEVTAAVTSDD